MRSDHERAEHQQRRREQGDLGAGADGDVDGQVHLVLAGDEHRDPVLGRVADDRHDDGPDEELAEPDAARRLGELRATSKLRMPDCCVLYSAEQHNAAIATFDDKLAARAADLGLTVATSEP